MAYLNVQHLAPTIREKMKDKSKLLAATYCFMVGLTSFVGPKVSTLFRPDGLIGRGDSATYEIVAKFEATQNLYPQDWTEWFWPDSFWEPVQTMNYGLSPSAAVKLLILIFGDSWTKAWVLLQSTLVASSWLMISGWFKSSWNKKINIIYSFFFLVNPFTLHNVFNVQKEVFHLFFIILVLHGFFLGADSTSWKAKNIIYFTVGSLGIFWVRGPLVCAVLYTSITAVFAWQSILNRQNKTFWIKGLIISSLISFIFTTKIGSNQTYRMYDIIFSGKKVSLEILENKSRPISANYSQWQKIKIIKGKNNFSNDMLKFQEYLRETTQKPVQKVPQNDNLLSGQKNESLYLIRAQQSLKWKYIKFIPDSLENVFLALAVKRKGFKETPANSNLIRPIPDSFLASLLLLPAALGDAVFQPLPRNNWKNGYLESLAWGNLFLWLFLIGRTVFLRKKLSKGFFNQESGGFYNGLLIICIINLMVLGFTCLNMGTLIRLRFCYWTILLAVILKFLFPGKNKSTTLP